MRLYKLKKMKRVHGLHFTPCGTGLLACGGAEARMTDGAILLDLATGAQRARIDRFGTCHAVPPDASRFVLGGADNWTDGAGGIAWADLPDLGHWEQQRWPKRSLPPRYNPYALAFDPTGTRLAVAHTRPSGRRGNPHQLRLCLTIIDPDTGEPLIALPANLTTGVLSFSTDGTRLATTGGIEGEPTVIVFDLTARALLYLFAPPGSVTLAARFLPDGRLVVANGRSAYVLHANGREQFQLTGHTKQVNAVLPTPDGTRLLTAGHDGTVRTWDARTGAARAAFEWKIGAVTALALAPDGLTCAAAGVGGSVVVWDAPA